ncbi:hypothetical protein TNCV_1590081 [Trichonephila clavipes]|uniref:Uncharacterized protein n=1 Tax=Trichonephila clavipes TaxID=2585209 RepID=A0A8X6RJP3_TRICX|nr:hypothetical protein TNCV_1590081 [Trichonephila clavipes]
MKCNFLYQSFSRKRIADADYCAVGPEKARLMYRACMSWGTLNSLRAAHEVWMEKRGGMPLNTSRGFSIKIVLEPSQIVLSFE